MAEPGQSQVTTRKDSALILRQKSGGRHGVSTESGSDRVKADSNNRDCRDCYPVATALGTDLILKLGHYQNRRPATRFSISMRKSLPTIRSFLGCSNKSKPRRS